MNLSVLDVCVYMYGPPHLYSPVLTCTHLYSYCIFAYLQAQESDSRYQARGGLVVLELPVEEQITFTKQAQKIAHQIFGVR